MPARPITLRLVAASRIALVALVELRIARPSYWPIIAASSSGGLPVISSTSTPRARKISAALGSILSLISTLGILRLQPRASGAQNQKWERIQAALAGA